MATVPIYQPNQVRDQALQGGYQQEIDVTKNTKALAQGLGVAGQMLDRVATRDAEAASNTVDTKIAAGWLKWDAENRSKYQGEKAGEYTAAAEDWWGKAAQTYGSTLDTMAKGMVSNSLNRRQAASLGQVAQFVEAEKEKHIEEVYTANVSTTIQFGVTSGDVAGAAERLKELVAGKGGRKEWKTQQVQDENLKHLSQLHTAQIAKLIDQPGGAIAANEYYTEHKAEVGFAQQSKIEQVIKAEGDNQFANTEAVRLRTLPPKQQKAELLKITDPIRLEKTQLQMRNLENIDNQAQAAIEKRFSDQAWQLAGQGKKVPEAILASMDGRERVQLQEHLRSKAERGNVAVKTNWGVYIDARERLAAGEEIELRALTEKIAPAQMEQLLDLKTSGKGNNASIATAEQQMSTYIDKMKIGGSKNAEKRGQFKSAAQDMFNEHLKRTGKKPSFEERRDILDMLTTEVVTSKGWVYDDTAPAYTLPREKQISKLPGGGPTTFSPNALPRVKTLAEARALPPGTHFLDANGVERIR